MIEVRDITKRYRDKLAVNKLSFNVETGKVTGFLGPNGAGKSTTMRLMLGLDGGTGQTLFDGKPLNKYAKPSHVVGVLLDAKSYHPGRTARQHLRILALEGGIPKKRVDEVLELVGLTAVAKKRPGKFSLGMSQRLGIAAALLGEPKYLILDEPANGLDPEGIAWLREFIKKYASMGNAVLVSSHLLSEMALMADNVIVIGRGKLIANSPIDDLVAGSSHAHVIIKSPKLSVLEREFKKQKIVYEKADKSLKITGSKLDSIGKIAYELGVPVYELSQQTASLEDAFLELTEGEQEYSGKDKEAKK